MNGCDKSVGRYISILYRRAQSYISSQMKAYNIGSGQYIFLFILYERDGISQEELSQKLMIDKGTTARAIDKLEKAGYVMRRKNPEDRRAYNIFITDKAREIQPVLHKMLASWTDILVSDLSEEERAMLYRIMEKMVNSTMAYMKEN
ncbi:MarR family winged helix-turn-helix transcriptional regulator [Cellulosilyticum sp. I15G10I2]|uniref:MarR family winged helix-turn-helix transcriptional regulator n=1 Tax=Cellulosilyticum sp. I15G10I2 TaxID=1892843 RepID=UPI00085CB448|nr:MarR family transcriptional regulator [Cellulosilyticum sp. I15G10I2]